MHQALCHNPGNKTEITAKALAFSFPEFIRKLFFVSGVQKLDIKILLIVE